MPMVIIIIIISRYPLIILLLMIFFSLIPGLHVMSFVSYCHISDKSKQIIDNLLKICYISGLLNIAFNYYTWLNSTITYYYFKIYCIMISSVFLSYIFTARYILYLKINVLIVPWYITLFYCLTTLGLCLRGVTSFSWFIIPFVYNFYPHYGLLLAPPLDNDMPPSSSPADNSPRYGGFFSRHNHNHYYAPLPPKSHFYKNCGLTIGVIGAGCSLFACYTYHKAANAAIMAAFEARRQADAAAVSAGVITKETYYERHPTDRDKK
jgi:hypothetical protein